MENEKKGISQITGNTEIKLGEKTFYKVTRIHRMEDHDKVKNALWKIYVKEKGSWRELNPNPSVPPKKGDEVSYTITNQSLVGKELLVEAYIYEPEKTAPPGLKIKVVAGEKKKIHRVELFMVDDTHIKEDTVLKYNQTIKVKVYTQNMPRELLKLTLYEDYADGGGHNPKNKKNKVAYTEKRTNDKGFLWYEFKLNTDFSKIANAMMDGSSDKLHEYYVLVESAKYGNKTSKNIEVENPDYVVHQTYENGKVTDHKNGKIYEGGTIEEVIIKGKYKKQMGIDPIPNTGRSVSIVSEPPEKKEEKEKNKCPNCDKPITAEELKTIFPNASDTNLKVAADTYSKYMKDLKMNTCWNKAHFFAQAKVESGDALSLKEGEGFNYYWEALIGTFKAFQSKEGREKAKLWGRAIRDRKDPKAVDVSTETQIKIANYAYSPPAAKAKELGNTSPNDGWNYRGRGLIQVTGKAFYQYCNPYTLKYNNIDVLQNPDAIGERLDLCVSSGMIFFKWKKINELANNTRDVKNKICPLVGNDIIRNGISKNHQPKQDAFDDITSKVFKIDECTINGDSKKKSDNSKCPEDCSQCFEYADVWENPEISSDNGGKNNNRYGYNSSRGHKGIDILSGPTYKEIHSIMCGEVVSLVNSFKTNEYRKSSLGNTLMIKSKTKDGKTVFILYCHLDKIYVKKGDKIKHGQKVALSGSTGNASFSGLPNGVKGHGIDKKYWHCHIEAATKGEGYNNFYSLGSYRIKAEDYMKTKFDKDGNAIK